MKHLRRLGTGLTVYAVAFVLVAAAYGAVYAAVYAVVGAVWLYQHSLVCFSVVVAVPVPLIGAYVIGRNVLDERPRD